MLLQIKSAKVGLEQTTDSREEQDELELPNFRKHARGAGLPLLGQVCLIRHHAQPCLAVQRSTMPCGPALKAGPGLWRRL